MEAVPLNMPSPFQCASELQLRACDVQELYRWPKVAEAARSALGLRYRLLPYLYTAFRRTAGHGCPLARPLFLAWPSDRHAHEAYHQWLMGDAVLITPVLDEVSCGLSSDLFGRVFGFECLGFRPLFWHAHKVYHKSPMLCSSRPFWTR
jgi:hypothetical protein